MTIISILLLQIKVWTIKKKGRNVKSCNKNNYCFHEQRVCPVRFFATLILSLLNTTGHLWFLVEKNSLWFLILKNTNIVLICNFWKPICFSWDSHSCVNMGNSMLYMCTSIRISWFLTNITKIISLLFIRTMYLTRIYQS